MKVLNVIKDVVFGVNIFALVLVLLVCFSRTAGVPSVIAESGRYVETVTERCIDNSPLMESYSEKMRKVGEYEAMQRFKHNPEFLNQEAQNKG